ncbi:MAG TPA: zf-HC2 domain-containing protein [Blastocatellia bacterium]|nr:zf-HC2 domain-containing protein [Blastocatellia bacterium]
MSESLDRRLSLGERVTLDLHLRICIWCVRYMEQIRALRRISSHYDAAQIENSIASTEQSLSPEARERIKRALQQKNR